MTSQYPASWYPDPFGRYEVRYWDGWQWTHFVGSRGYQTFDPPAPGPQAQPFQQASQSVEKRVQRQVDSVGPAAPAPIGVGPLFTEPVLVVNQRAKLFEVKAEYAVYDQSGRQIAKVRQVGENFMKKAMSLIPDDDRARRLLVVDMQDHVVLAITRPAKLIRSTVTVTAGDGSLIGRIVQKNFGIVGKYRFDLEAGGRRVGSINAEDWSAWDFGIHDSAGDEIARITKTWAGTVREWFTKADHYVVQIHRPVQGPMRSLVVASALAMDTVLRQDSSESTRW